MEVLLVNNEKAALFDYNDFKKKAKIKRVFQNEDYAKKESELFTHKAGRQATSYSHDQASFSDNNGFKDELVHKFTNDIMDYVNELNRSGHLHDLIIISEPSVLGKLRKKTTKELDEKISKEVPKNFYTEKRHELEKYLSSNVLMA